jgi:hypothetical protein
MLIHRYSPDGRRISTKQFGSESDDSPFTMSLDSTGHLYVGAQITGTYDGYATVGSWDALVMRFDVGDVVPTTTTTTTTVAPTTSTTTTTIATKPVSNWRLNKRISLKVVAIYSGLSVATGSKVAVLVAPVSKLICRVSQGTLKGMMKGNCRVTVSVKSRAGNKKSKTVSFTMAD